MIARVSHIRLVGLVSERNKLMDKLTENGLFEARETDAVSYALRRGDSALYRELKLKQSRVSFALEFLKARHAAMSAALDANAREVKAGRAEPLDYVLSKEKYSATRTLITRADFSDARAREYELLHVCDELQKLSFAIVDCKNKINEVGNAMRAYEPYAASPLRMSEYSRGGDIALSAYHSRTATPPEETLDALPCAYELRRDDGLLIITVCRKSVAAEIDKGLGALGYVKCPFDDDCTATQKIDALRGELNDAERQATELTKAALEYEKYVKDLRILYDVIGLEIERAEAEQRFLKTDSTFVLEGWLPEAVAEATVAGVREVSDSALIQLLAPEERDAPPSIVVNSKVVKPYEQITDMYSSPRYREIDPNPIMAIFYFLFFGIMIGDAAYGVVLAIAGFFIGTSKRFDTGIKKLALLVGMGGISAIIWGILFGGYFSIDFGFKIAILIDPIKEPLLLLVLSIGLGCLQLIVGYIIKFVALCKEGKPFSAIFDCGSILLLFAALVFVVIGMLPSLAPMLGITVSFAPPSWIAIVAAALALTGVALILIFGGRKSKNVFGKVVGGFKGLYGLINILSDILSYCRLFGLCLASCAIGLAFNSLGDILFGVPVVGYVIGVIVLIPLHAFNLGLGVLSAYVHDARLQFLEFYGKFYDGGGRLFSPLGSRTKYVRYS